MAFKIIAGGIVLLFVGIIYMTFGWMFMPLIALISCIFSPKLGGLTLFLMLAGLIVGYFDMDIGMLLSNVGDAVLGVTLLYALFHSFCN